MRRDNLLICRRFCGVDGCETFLRGFSQMNKEYEKSIGSHSCEPMLFFINAVRKSIDKRTKYQIRIQVDVQHGIVLLPFS